MVKIGPFSALRYDTEKVSLKKVVCPPYDVINRQQEKEYINKSPYNIVKIVLPERKNRRRDYARAKRDFYGWIEKGILKPDDASSIYVYIQEYKIGKENFSRCGFLSLLELRDENKTEVLPHERIFSKPFLDRTSLMKKARAHLSPIFIVFRDPRGITSGLVLNTIKNTRPELDFSFEGVRHKLWRITQRTFIDQLTQKVNSSKLFIADGHHRFEASIAVKDYFGSLYKKRTDKDGYARTLVYLVSSQDKGLTILPTYRAVKILPKNFSMEYMLKKLNGHFKIRTIAARKVQEALQRTARKRECGFVIFYENRYLFLLLKDKKILKQIGPKNSSYNWRRLDVSILHNLVFAKLLGIKERVGSYRNIYYYKESKELIEKIKSGEHRLGAFLNPTKMEEVERIAEAGERMPHKSTYFYPKPLTGLVIHKF